MFGLVSYASYIPKTRITTDEIASFWKKDGAEVATSLGVVEKSVAGIDEDAVTLAIEASSRALGSISLDPSRIEAIFVGSESHPYAVNPTSTIVGEFLGVGNNYFAADLEFACKAATTGLQMVGSLIESKRISYGLVIGSHTAQARPHDILEYTSGSASCAFFVGGKTDEIIVHIIDYASFSSDTPDFWRRDGMRYPSHGGRFTGEPSYYAHVVGASQKLLEKTKYTPSDFDYCVFHMPNGKFPLEVAKRLGFTAAQMKPSLTVAHIGNPYSASALVGLSAVLDIAKPKERIFFCSYGSGAGADSFVFETTRNLATFKKAPTISEQMATKRYISYAEYLRQTKAI